MNKTACGKSTSRFCESVSLVCKFIMPLTYWEVKDLGNIILICIYWSVTLGCCHDLRSPQLPFIHQVHGPPCVFQNRVTCPLAKNRIHRKGMMIFQSICALGISAGIETN